MNAEDTLMSLAPQDDVQLNLYEAKLLKDCENRIEVCEKKIEAGIKAIYELGEALLTIRDAKLYRQTHETFRDYCREKWNYGKSHAYRLIDFSQTYAILKDAAVVPLTERQIRPLQKLPLDKQRLAWDVAVTLSQDGRVTTRQLKAAVNQFLGEGPSGRRRQFGEPIDFEGLRHAPINEQGVVFLFGLRSRSLGFTVESVQSGFPDCSAKRLVDAKRNRWEQVEIEFEYKSRSFLEHVHDYKSCDLLVCWIHNWPDCPVPVLELREEVRRLAKVNTPDKSLP